MPGGLYEEEGLASSGNSSEGSASNANSARPQCQTRKGAKILFAYGNT